MKTNILSIVTFALSFLLIYSCKKEYALIDDVPLSEMKLPEIETITVTNITQNSALVISSILDNGGGRVTASGICWSPTSENPTLEDFITIDGYSEGEFNTLLTGLNIGSSYYVRSYATNPKGTTYGDVKQFTTTEPLPVVATPTFSDITSFSAKATASILEYEETVIRKGFCWNLEGNPTIEDFTTECEQEPGEFTCELQDLEEGNVYTVRAYAINSVGVSYSNPATLVMSSGEDEYSTVKIGEQTWMIENLKVTHYRNGDPIERVNDDSEWGDVTGKYGAYQNNNEIVPVSGYLYNWYALTDPRGIAPEGWRVPTEEDWTQLVNYLGGEAVAGGKLKSTDPAHWNSPNTGATNSSGFTAVGGGVAHVNVTGANLGVQGIYWSSSDVNEETGLIRIMGHDHTQAIYSGANKKNGYSVRLIKDE